MIVILDYGMGNTASILNMIRRVGGDAVITSDLELISKAGAIILPGVGHFDNAMQKLRASGLIEPIKKSIFEDKIPFLGVCLGMQLLFDSSEEGTLPGLGFLPGEVKRFDITKSNNPKLKIPHMGWNKVHSKADHPLFKNFDSTPRFYFVHSYHAVCKDSAHIVATCTHGYPFTCVVQRDNILGAQFHPEKSHKFGMQLFKNFLEQL